MTMPNFLIIGAAKSGTTALYAYLKQHPEIYMSPVKEPRFFAFEGEPQNYNGPKNEGERFNRETIFDLTTYLSLFENAKDEKAIGEASPAYLSRSEKASKRIRHYIPDVKLIVILRQPAERAYSAFLHTVRQGTETNLNFETALALENKRIKHNWESIWHHKSLGFYYRQLAPYYEKFDKQQIKIYLFDDLEKNASALVKDIFTFLEVDNSFNPDISERINASGIPRSRWVYDFFGPSDNLLRDALKFFVPDKFRKPLVKKIKSENLIRPQISKELRWKLTAEYRDDILKLQDLIDRDLSPWLME
jgi:hypothetical protein